MKLRFILFLLAGLMSSCASLDSPKPFLLTKTPQPTATIVWFPPSATPSPQYISTRAPTPEMRPGVENIFLADDFSDPALWDVAASNEASAEVDGSRLNLAVQSQVYMISLRHETILNNFYAEITARPSLCRSADSYGVLVRANAIAYYQFGLTCDGSVFAERISVNTRESLQKPLLSGDVPPGAPGEVRIGVWALGDEMRLFLNGRYQFSISNSNYPSGTLGVFVKSAGETPVIVSFSDLSVQKINFSLPTKTPQP